MRGALDEFRLSASAVFAMGSSVREVLIVDDANETVVASAIEEVCRQHHFTYLRTPSRLWYPGAVNFGAKRCVSDVLIVLNSDTIAPTHIAVAVARCFEDPKVGVIGFLGNAAGYQSVPWNRKATGPYPICDLPDGFDPAAMSRAVQKLELGRPAEVEWVNGFAFAVRCQDFMTVGGFDCAAFPYGYGEEIDLCLRLRRNGLRCVVDPAVFVFHSKTRSYSPDERRALIEQSHAALHSRWGRWTIWRARRSLRRNKTLATARRRIADLYS